jgi:hypothetical protein
LIWDSHFSLTNFKLCITRNRLHSIRHVVRGGQGLRGNEWQVFKFKLQNPCACLHLPPGLRVVGGQAQEPGLVHAHDPALCVTRLQLFAKWPLYWFQGKCL